MKRRHHESQAQQALIAWMGYEQKKYPELAYLYSIPNDIRTTPRRAAIAKAMGMKAGVPDLCLPAPRGPWHGLYIEMKHGKNKPSPDQKDFLRYLSSVGYATRVCYSAQAASDEILAYLKLPKPPTQSHAGTAPIPA